MQFCNDEAVLQTIERLWQIHKQVQHTVVRRSSSYRYILPVMIDSYDFHNMHQLQHQMIERKF